MATTNMAVARIVLTTSIQAPPAGSFCKLPEKTARNRNGTPSPMAKATINQKPKKTAPVLAISARMTPSTGPVHGAAIRPEVRPMANAPP